MADSNSNFALAFLLAFAFMYMILAAQFESLVHPITILMAVPLTLPFALVSLLIAADAARRVRHDRAVHAVRHRQEERHPCRWTTRTCCGAGACPATRPSWRRTEARLRPILMTTIMLVAAMIPIATGQGPGAGARASMAKVILGGQRCSACC